MRRTHGMSNSPLYRVWSRIKGSTTNPSHQDYRWYGGKGIRVCDEWSESFLAFYEWATANGYSKGLTLDRRNVNGNYEPNNCRWITIAEQQRNRSDNVLIAIGGETKCLSEWCRIYDINRFTVLCRHERGIDWETALTTPVEEKMKRYIGYKKRCTTYKKNDCYFIGD